MLLCNALCIQGMPFADLDIQYNSLLSLYSSRLLCVIPLYRLSMFRILYRSTLLLIRYKPLFSLYSSPFWIVFSLLIRFNFVWLLCYTVADSFECSLLYRLLSSSRQKLWDSLHGYSYKKIYVGYFYLCAAITHLG